MKREDIEFLKELQGRLINADAKVVDGIEDERNAVFYVVGEKIKNIEPRLFEPDGFIIFDSEMGYEYEDMHEFYEEIKEYLEQDRFNKAEIEMNDNTILFKLEMKYGILGFSLSADDDIEDVQYAIDCINEFTGLSTYDCYQYQELFRPLPRLLFFTKEEAERCLEANKRYLTDPFIGVTTSLNPELKKLHRIIKETDWSKLEEENV